MLQVTVVDSTAERRIRLVERLSEFLKPGAAEVEYLPGISITPLSLQELRFRALPDICVIGQGILSEDIAEVAELRQRLPDVILLVELGQQQTGIGILEQLARYGVDDFISAETSGLEFVRKIVMLSRRVTSERGGKLVLVDSGKGGVGVTSIAVGLAECLLESNQRVVVADLDFQSQDASRFLQSRPYVNENLQVICMGQRPATREQVAECLTPVWADEERFLMLPPLPESDALYDPKSIFARSLLTVFEVLDHSFDAIIIDMGNVTGAIRRSLYRVADALLYVVNNDAAAAYASIGKLQCSRALLPVDATVVVLENAAQRHGLPTSLLQREILRAARLPESAWLSGGIPFCSTGMKWPGSGGTLYSQSNRAVRRAFKDLGSAATLLESQTASSAWMQTVRRTIKRTPTAAEVRQRGQKQCDQNQKQIDASKDSLLPAISEQLISRAVIS